MVGLDVVEAHVYLNTLKTRVFIPTGVFPSTATDLIILGVIGLVL